MFLAQSLEAKKIIKILAADQKKFRHFFYDEDFGNFSRDRNWVILILNLQKIINNLPKPALRFSQYVNFACVLAAVTILQNNFQLVKGT